MVLGEGLKKWPVNRVVFGGGDKSLNRVVLGEGLIKMVCKQGGPW